MKELSAKELPDLSLAMSLPLKESFSVFNDFHRECGMSLVEILLSKYFQNVVTRLVIIYYMKVHDVNELM